MTTLVLMGAALLLLLVLTLVVLRPWWQRPNAAGGLQALNVSVFNSRMQELEQDQAQGRLESGEFEQQKLALQRQLLAAAAPQAGQGRVVRVSRLGQAMVGLWIPLLVLLVYVLVANRGETFRYLQAQDRYRTQAAQILQGQEPQGAGQIEDGVGLLQAIQSQVYEKPQDPQLWLHLSQAYTAAEATEPAVQALERAHRLAPDDDRITMTYAQMRFFTQQGKLDDTTRRMVQDLLQRQPNHEGALMLMAMGSFRNADYAQAIDWLQRLRALRLQHDTPESASVQALDKALTEARTAQQNSLSIQVTVQLSPALRAQVQPTDTVFVYVKALQGMPMPYAVHKRSADVLLSGQPLSETLSDQDAMMPGRTLSAGKANGETLVVGARISKSGNPLPQPGDLEALPVPLGQQTRFVLSIDQQR